MQEKKHGVIEVHGKAPCWGTRIGPSPGFDEAEFRETLHRGDKVAQAERSELESEIRELSTFFVVITDISHRLTDAVEQEAVRYALTELSSRINDLKNRIVVLRLGAVAA